MDRTQIGAKVACCDGWCGTLKRLVVDSGGGKTTYLVIETAPLLPHDAIVPIEHMIATGYEAIFLNLTLAKLEAYRERG